jgi:hypothetical protein
MNKLNSRRKLLLAAAGGFAAFLVLIITDVTYFILSVWMGRFGFGPGLLSPVESLIVSVIASVLISLGAGIPAWALGVNRRRGFLAGLAATATL